MQRGERTGPAVEVEPAPEVVHGNGQVGESAEGRRDGDTRPGDSAGADSFLLILLRCLAAWGT